ncbi:benenodin family lasso peptide [Novosphingobium sp. JCM 18896]|nr:benenodin family lasso peptide [Novosphingobium sp. JCM 18896]MCW1430887.1 benenodin family lasso peptide [Novosphingobium sp. JCM 18896]
MDRQEEPDVIELGIASRETLGPIGFIAEEVLGMVVAGLEDD